jgi:hypothetical protein
MSGAEMSDQSNDEGGKSKRGSRKRPLPGHQVALSQMAPGDSQVRRHSYDLREALEAAVVAKAGSISVAQACKIHTAAVALRRHLQVERRLAKAGATLSVEQWCALADRSVRYKLEVDRCLASLGLEALAKEPDPWALAMRALPPAAPQPVADSPPAAIEAPGPPAEPPEAEQPAQVEARPQRSPRRRAPTMRTDPDDAQVDENSGPSWAASFADLAPTEPKLDPETDSKLVTEARQICKQCKAGSPLFVVGCDLFHGSQRREPCQASGVHQRRMAAGWKPPELPPLPSPSANQPWW